jgi:hypothetical protein
MRKFITLPFKIVGALAMGISLACIAICFGTDKAERISQGFSRVLNEVHRP